MNKKILCGALLGALGFAQAAVAVENDDRWYVSGNLGIASFDDDRGINNDYLTGGIGFGKFYSPNWSFDVELDSTNPRKSGERFAGTQLNWSMYSASLVGRYHFFREEGNTWWPYIAFGAGVQRHEEEFSPPRGGPLIERNGNEFLAQIGGGLQGDYGRTSLRLEATQRFDFDGDSPSGGSNYADTVVGVSVLVKLGEASSAPAVTSAPEVPPAPVKTCADLDDDGDGVNNCNDKCPNSQAGQTVGPDGCPVPVTIDLRGVNFDFDKSTLRPDAVAILTEAVSILQKYPELRVEVAGHTDSVGTDAYNQGLSERRARAVYDYLTSNGIAASRLAGPNGFGESRPIDTNDTADGRARNRRTELNVQN